MSAVFQWWGKETPVPNWLIALILVQVALGIPRGIYLVVEWLS